ncbi:hypothetical protein [Brevibacillus reuszeri]|uniref:hypothetical protein n=1 Tax=Brevibacillus reuszeri TaxID=54915 RepID=UPI00289F8E17|nr:hypothetical protein [Brevibacillus reuszeri]
MEYFKYLFQILCIAILFPTAMSLIYSINSPVASSQTKPYIPVETRTYTVNQQRNNDQSTFDFDDDIKRSWSKGIDRLKVSTTDYLQFNYFETNKITQKMGDEEATSFNDTLLESFISVRKKGDLVPVVLMNRELSKSILVFQENEGKGGFVGIFMSVDSSTGKKKWQLDSIENL